MRTVNNRRRRHCGLAGRGARGNRAPVKIGFLGGSFDPVHLGHLAAARLARGRFGLDRVVLLPAASSPAKSRGPAPPGASAGDRLDMVRAAARDGEWLEVSEHELRRGGVSYSVESARHFRGCFPEARLFWIIGSDLLEKLPLWRGVGELAGLVEFIVLQRPGHAPEIPATCGIPGLRLHPCAGELPRISSSELREQLREGRPVGAFVPREVAALIRERGLYRRVPAGDGAK
jgi:nicotinate-nucleotide adenylyltransferase